MKPVMQTVTGARGNCFSACLASVFECPLEDVPNFFDAADAAGTTWWEAVEAWLRPRGFAIITVQLASDQYAALQGWSIVWGKSERGFEHSTVWHGGKMVHDPHPSQSGIIKPLGVNLLYPIAPSTLVLRLTA